MEHYLNNIDHMFILRFIEWVVLDPMQCEGWRTNDMTLFLVVTMMCACWFVWRAHWIEDFKWHRRFHFKVVFWKVVLRAVYFEGPIRVWRALETLILNTDSKGHFTHKSRAVTKNLWKPKRKCPKAVPTHFQNHVVWSHTLECSVKSYVTEPLIKCYCNEWYLCESFVHDLYE